MEVESSICLSDLVPALRWSRPQQVAEALTDARLPAAWWSSLPLSRALAMAGLDWICDRLALLATARWDYLPLADVLPALTIHHIDPALPGWPEPTRAAIAGLGGWHRLRRLSPGDMGTPSATPEAVLGSVFREVLGRISAQPESAARAVQAAGQPEAGRAPQRGPASGTGSFPAVGEGVPRTTGAFPAVGEGVPQRTTGTFPVAGEPQRATGATPAQGDGAPQRAPGAVPAQGEGVPQRAANAFPTPGDPGPATGMFAAQSGNRPGTGSFPAVGPGAGSPGDGGPSTGSFPAQRDNRPGTGSFPVPNANRPGTGSSPNENRPGTGSSPNENRSGTGSFPVPNANRPGAGPFPGNGGPSTGSFPALGENRPGNGLFSGPGDKNPSTGSFPAVGDNRQNGGPPPTTGSFPALGENGEPRSRQTGSFPVQNGNGSPQRPQPEAPVAAPLAAPATPAPSETDHAMVRVVDSLFRSLNKLELSVAVHRLFAEDPISLRTLAHKMLVERDVLSQAQRTAEERVLNWLRSSESAPVTGHMFRLTEWLGSAATQDQLIGADPAHPVMVPSLRTPLWRVLVTLMPDRRLQDGWLVIGDIHGLQSRTRQLLAASPPDTDMVALMTELGIRTHSAKAWLDALPAESGPDPVASAAPPQPLPRRTPGANGHHHRGGQPIPAASSATIDPTAALATLSALSGGRSPVLPGSLAGTPATPPPPLPSPSSDPRRWQRIDVTPEYLRGGPVPVPEGYATQLGMRPGTLLSVTGPGDNAIVLVWQGHQPVFDSLQPVLMRLNARPGDQVYVTVDGYRLEAQLTG
ncbi:hypothetical protein [Nonomuraea glycinis]|uniref:Uncharacterized protein n=1 Tax=Nonomuraea glycinis TaxID=2047744 RepID=A0A918ACW6_9ACTN|nr:hypothetical protein [Nonomuraea glycinis]GGP16488.1 hypothetical protein GCM10012278_80480 [Nonomuraea glycinis]